MKLLVDNQGVNLTYNISIQIFGFQKHFFNPNSADAALSTKAVNKIQTNIKFLKFKSLKSDVFQIKS